MNTLSVKAKQIKGFGLPGFNDYDRRRECSPCLPETGNHAAAGIHSR
jgi:hypothetical protein